MSERQRWERLIGLMEQERKLLDDFSEASGDMRSGLHSRDELKARLVTVRSRIRGVAGYANSRGRLGRELMEELVPSTRGRMYDKRGQSASAGRDPLVVSHHL